MYVLHSRTHLDYDSSCSMTLVVHTSQNNAYFSRCVCLNKVRHWWKTSRLLLRLAGGLMFCYDDLNWAMMQAYDVSKKKQAKQALKVVKRIGQGGPIRPFLQDVHPFTRSLRIVLAVARAWEAKVDNRLYEVGIAETFAFIGNRCSRYWARDFVDWSAKFIAFPLSAVVIAPYISVQSRPVIVVMGFLRAILPFVASFQGSRLGRQLTFNTYKYANYRWKSVQSIMHFHQKAGVYQDTNLDPDLLNLARLVAEGVGHGMDPEETRQALSKLGFQVFGSGSGGRAVYRMQRTDQIVMLHITPYGPSILDEMPRYILLERRSDFYINRVTDTSDGTILDAATPREASVQGFTYSGAFFQPQEWAALKMRFDRELQDYDNACRIMGTVRLPLGKRSPQRAKSASPPKDLLSLKAFIRSGRQTYKQRRDNTRWKEIEEKVQKMSKLVSKLQTLGKAPSRVILYLEGLDCAGKSSTGGIICQALEKSGYAVRTAQHNRPPTPEQKAKPWMDRIRFEYPDDLYDDDEEVPAFASVMWDRGPAGDFVYGGFQDATLSEKMQRYEEFRTYDYNCRAEGVLFCKVFFVTDRDSIAGTLGKRLAHKRIARDLRTWLDANSVEQFREGVQEIEAHIDPTDFIAFNKYEENLEKFTEVVRNTDYVGHVADQEHSSIGYSNPWIVVNTSNRHAARLNIMKAFYNQLKRFSNSPYDRIDAYDRLNVFFGGVDKVERVAKVTQPVSNTIVEDKEHGLSSRAVLQSMLLLLLVYAYANQTWNFDIDDIT
jgi:polyphosphate kinase 2 (PPK2 family)